MLPAGGAEGCVRGVLSTGCGAGAEGAGAAGVPSYLGAGVFCGAGAGGVAGGTGGVLRWSGFLSGAGAPGTAPEFGAGAGEGFTFGSAGRPVVFGPVPVVPWGTLPPLSGAPEIVGVVLRGGVDCGGEVMGAFNCGLFFSFTMARV